MAKRKQYKVLNPRRIPKDIRILRVEELGKRALSLFEGDMVDQVFIPADCREAWLEQGLIREV